MGGASAGGHERGDEARPNRADDGRSRQGGKLLPVANDPGPNQETILGKEGKTMGEGHTGSEGHASLWVKGMRKRERFRFFFFFFCFFFFFGGWGVRARSEGQEEEEEDCV